jgi:8-amino-7-oxononanoate synthase
VNERWFAELAGALERLRGEGRLRSIEERRGEDFVRNDYLGFASRPEIAEAAAAAARAEGAGAGAARLLGGDCASHRAAEAAASRWLRCEAALLFPSGSQANSGLLTSLAGPADAVFSDESNHASIIDGIHNSRARKAVYQHCDARDLARLLRLHRDARRKLIFTESVFSMDGKKAPLAEIVALAREYGAAVAVDEAHAAGLFGPTGAGVVEELRLENDVLARVVTGGKALGVAGAFVAGPRVVIDTVINFGRAFLFTTAPPPAVAGALAAAIPLAAAAGAERARLLASAAMLRGDLRRLGVECEPGDSPILFVRLGEAARAVEAARRLSEKGFDIRAVRPPTVSEGRSGLRIVVHAGHAEELLHRAAKAVAEVVRGVFDSAPPPDATIKEPAGARAARTERNNCTRGILVTGTDTGVGKTAVASMLLGIAAREYDAAYWKPVQTGRDADDDTNTIRARFEGWERVTVSDATFAFPDPIAPRDAAARAGARIDSATILRSAGELHRSARERNITIPGGATRGALLVVEGAGGLLVPLDDGVSQDQVFADLRLPAVVVARTGLGTINHTRLTLEALAARRIPLHAIVLFGAEHRENQRTLAEYAPPGKVLWVSPPASFDAESLRAAGERAGLAQLLDSVPAWPGPRAA